MYEDTVEGVMEEGAIQDSREGAGYNHETKICRRSSVF